jgi:hypothetical protein
MTGDDLPEFDVAGAFDGGPWSNPRGCGVLVLLAAMLFAVIGLIAKSGEAFFNG